MGTLASVQYPAPFEAEVVEAFAKIQELDHLLSTYREDSEISRLNREFHLQAGHPAVIEILTRARQISELTWGYFDVTVGALVHDVYRFEDQDEHFSSASLDGRARPPSPNAVARALRTVDYRALAIDGRQVTLLGGQGRVDLGGIGKGFAVDQAAAWLAAAGMTEGRVALSGDIRCFDRCRVAIENPIDPEVPLASFVARERNLAISTSGGYGRFKGNVSINHLINPKTGLSAQELISATVLVAGDNTLADALATAISVMPQGLVEKIFGSLNHVAYVLFPRQGPPVVSRNFNQLAGEITFGTTPALGGVPDSNSEALSKIQRTTK